MISFTEGGEWTLEAYRPLSSAEGSNFDLKIGNAIYVCGKLATIESNRQTIFATETP